MKVFKFGGASVKNAEAVKNVEKVIRLYDDDLTIVISAMDKTTNALEKVVESYMNADGKCLEYLQQVKDFHYLIIKELFGDCEHQIFQDIHNSFVEIEWEIEDAPTREYDYVYDQIVSVGEIVSTKIVSAYLNYVGVNNKWIDIRNIIQTDNTHRDARINWELTEKLANDKLACEFTGKEQTILITQGFIGSSSENFTTTLGREGSDFTAGILAYCLNANDVTIWKDVPGMLNADPKYFNDTQKLNNISYREAIELAYYGASVIHPKTIKPLQNKNIPLYVKSFVNPNESGTLINENTSEDSFIPSYIFKKNLVLISISVRDYSFIMEDHLSHIFGVFSQLGVKIHLMQNSAISFSVCVDYNQQKISKLIENLNLKYAVKYNDDVELLTIRHYDEETINKFTKDKETLLIQKSRNSVRIVMK
ncbi:MAG: aspartate kinase [Flavobacteriales bacterium]|nr:aspartate kinase [Flavobacteriales bacterium]